MGNVQQAVLDFDEAVLAPWRPRLRPVPAAGGPRSLRPVVADRRPPSSARASAPAAAVPPRGAAGPGRPAVPRGASGPARRTPASGVSPGRPARPGCAARRRPDAPPLRLTARARRLGVVLALTSCLALGSWLGSLLGGGGEALRLVGESSVVVERGDTLWSIASSVAGDGDVRAVVDSIRRLNRLDSADLVPGQRIRLP